MALTWIMSDFREKGNFTDWWKLHEEFLVFLCNENCMKNSYFLCNNDKYMFINQIYEKKYS